MYEVTTLGVLLTLSFAFAVTGYAQEVDRSISLGRYQAPVFVQLSGQTYLLEVSDLDNKGQEGERPQLLSGGRTVVGILAGGALGAGIGTIGAFVGVYIESGVSTLELGEYPIVGMLAGFSIGYIFGSAIGVYSVRNMDDETGSFRATLIGSTLGFGAGAPFMGVGVLLGAPIGATIGFDLTRRYDPPAESETALINIRDGQMSLTVPRVYLRPDFSGGGNLSRCVDLLRVRFQI